MSLSTTQLVVTAASFPEVWNFVDRTGQRYNKLTALAYVGETKWVCRCECGQLTCVLSSNLRGNTTSCGCEKRRATSERRKTHGMRKSTEYNIWSSMKARCYNPKSTEYFRYGARGISVCEAWRTDFSAFFQDMGKRPLGRTLDRINNNGNYEPGNCRWATPTEQGANNRRNTYVVMSGEKLTLSQAIRQLGFKKCTVMARMRQGNTAQQAIDKGLPRWA